MSSVCLRCGRPLKSKVSSKRGYGSACYKKVLADKAREDKEKKDIEEIEENEK